MTQPKVLWGRVVDRLMRKDNRASRRQSLARLKRGGQKNVANLIERRLLQELVGEVEHGLAKPTQMRYASGLVQQDDFLDHLFDRKGQQLGKINAHGENLDRQGKRSEKSQIPSHQITRSMILPVRSDGP